MTSQIADCTLERYSQHQTVVQIARKRDIMFLFIGHSFLFILIYIFVRAVTPKRPKAAGDLVYMGFVWRGHGFRAKKIQRADFSGGVERSGQPVLV